MTCEASMQRIISCLLGKVMDLKQIVEGWVGWGGGGGVCVQFQ